jgi:signal transduction histidine kinase
VGSETGIGLAINYQIIVEKHKYHLKFNRIFGRYTQLLIEITLRMQDFYSEL